MNQATDPVRQIGPAPGGEVEALNNLGAVHLARGEVTAARDCHNQSLALSRQISSAWDEAHALAGLGRCAHATGRNRDAANLLRQAHSIFARIYAHEAHDVAAEIDSLPEDGDPTPLIA